jgi:hypothetical protein
MPLPKCRASAAVTEIIHCRSLHNYPIGICHGHDDGTMNTKKAPHGAFFVFIALFYGDEYYSGFKEDGSQKECEIAVNNCYFLTYLHSLRINV